MIRKGPAPPEDPKGRPESLPFLFGMTSLFADMTYELAHVLLPVMMMHLGGSAALTAVMESGAEGSKLAGFVASGQWGTTPNKERLLVRWGYGITAGATVLMGSAGAPAILVLLKGVSWFGKGLRGPARDAMLSLALPKDSHARAFATVKALDQVGGLLGPLLALALTGLLSPFAIVDLTIVPGLLCLLFAVLATRAALRHRVQADGPPAPSRGGILSGAVRHQLGRPEVRRYLAGGALLRAGTFPATLLMFRFVAGSGTFSVTVGGFLLASLFTILTNMAIARDHIKATSSRLFVLAILTIPLASMLLAPAHPDPRLYLLSMALWGAGEAASSLGLKLRGIGLWPPVLRSPGLALFEFGASLLSLMVWPLLAHLWDQGHTGAGMAIAALLSLAGAGLLIKDPARERPADSPA